MFDRSQTYRDVFVTCQKANRIPPGVQTQNGFCHALALTLCTLGIQSLIFRGIRILDFSRKTTNAVHSGL